ncbi:MAG: helical backbone metal receptor [Dysgonamonadaceae bacterium]|nr:helical backbone metal receptor [Dysgonamonadaceae bacterium]
MKKLFLFLLGLIAFVAQGQPAKRIVSLAPSLTQSLYFLGAQDQLAGCTSYCEVAKKDKKPIVATAVKLNIEKLLSVKPDLVIVMGLTSTKDIETIRKFGIEVALFESPKSFEEMCQQFTNLGEIVGKQVQAYKIVADSKQKIDKIVASRKSKPYSKIFFQIGIDPIFSVLSHTYMDDYITLLKGENIASRLKHGTVGREFVIAANPDYIFIAAMGVVGDVEKKTWLKYRSLNASKEKRIFIVDAEIACQPNPINFVHTMEALVKQMK